MKQNIHAIIRDQWSLRHSADRHTRIQARNLILAHVTLARQLDLASSQPAPAPAKGNLIAPLYTPLLHAA